MNLALSFLIAFALVCAYALILTFGWAVALLLLAGGALSALGTVDWRASGGSTVEPLRNARR